MMNHIIIVVKVFYFLPLKNNLRMELFSVYYFMAFEVVNQIYAPFP
jgi:hypothetical protein